MTSKSYPNIRHLVLSGGGLLGIGYVGLLRYLQETGIFGNIKTITGCSAGSIFGSLMAVGYDAQYMEQVIKEINFKNYVNITADSILNFMKTKGLESGSSLMTLIKKHIKDKTGDENITFSQIREKYNIELRIGVTNLTKERFEFLTYNNKPDLPIHIAIKASCAIPFIFEPVIIDDDVYCDGGLLENLPLDSLIDSNMINFMTEEQVLKKVDEKESENKEFETKESENKDKKDKNAEEQNLNNLDIHTLAVYLMNQPETINKSNLGTVSINNYFNVLTRTISQNIICNKMSDSTINKHTKLLVFNIPCDIMTFIKINASREDIDNIIQIAYNHTKKEFEELAELSE